MESSCNSSAVRFSIRVFSIASSTQRHSASSSMLSAHGSHVRNWSMVMSLLAASAHTCFSTATGWHPLCPRSMCTSSCVSVHRRSTCSCFSDSQICFPLVAPSTPPGRFFDQISSISLASRKAFHGCHMVKAYGRPWVNLFALNTCKARQNIQNTRANNPTKQQNYILSLDERR